MSRRIIAPLLAAVALLYAGTSVAATAAVATAAANSAGCGTPACAPACAPACNPCAPTITYVHHGRKICCCLAPIQSELQIQIPDGCTCTTVNVPVCLPGCCNTVPEVNCRWGCLGRGVLRYDYCCGVTVKIIVRLNGDIVVHYIHA